MTNQYGPRFLWLLAYTCLAALIASAAEAQTFYRLQTLPVVTTTVTQAQFLRGERDGSVATIAGELRIPGPLTDTHKLPAVLLLHGLGGANISHDRWADELSGMGVAVLLLDSFSGRKLYTLAEQGSLSNQARMLDAFAALDLLGQHLRIDPSRIVVMGFSGGAPAALYSSTERFNKMYGRSGMQFAAHIALYAPCYITFREDTRTTGMPIRLYHGAADDFLPVGPCRSFVDRLKQGGADATLTEYPDAHHAYDNVGFPAQPLKFAQAATPRNCVVEEGENGQIVNAKTAKPFDSSDSCWERGPHVAYNAAAHQATVQAVKSFLKDVFKLP